MAGIRDNDASSARDRREQRSCNSLIISDICRTCKNQGRYSKIAHVREPWFLRKRHIAMLVILWRRAEQISKMLAGSVVSRRDEIGVVHSHFDRIFGSLKLPLGHDEVFGVWETLCFRTNKQQVTDLLWIS